MPKVYDATNLSITSYYVKFKVQQFSLEVNAIKLIYSLYE